MQPRIGLHMVGDYGRHQLPCYIHHSMHVHGGFPLHIVIAYLLLLHVCLTGSGRGNEPGQRVYDTVSESDDGHAA